MRIVHFHPDFRSAKIFVLPLVVAERKAGFCSELICDKTHYDDDIGQISYDLSFMQIWRTPLFMMNLRSYLLSKKPQIVVSHNCRSSLLPLLSALVSGISVRIYFNHGVPYAGHRGLVRLCLLILEWINVRLSTHIITVSSDMIDLLKFVSSRAAPVVINQGSACGLDLATNRSLRLDREGFRLQYDIRDSDFVVVFIGRPLNRKGFGLLIRWWCDRMQDDRFKLVLCGPTKDDVESISKSQAKNIRCLGYTDEVNVVLASADILILPSLHEGLSYACLEALAQGVIVLANDIPGVRCAIEHEVTGFLIENNSFEKYEKYIRAIQANRDGFETIRAHAKQDVERFSRDAFLATYILHLKMIVRS